MELKSEHSRQGVSVTFTYEQSTTLRGDEKQSRIPSGDESENNICCVSLMWMNYKGEEVEYKKLHPGELYIVVSAHTSTTSTSIHHHRLDHQANRTAWTRTSATPGFSDHPHFLSSSTGPTETSGHFSRYSFSWCLMLEMKRLSISKHTQTLLMISSIETWGPVNPRRSSLQSPSRPALTGRRGTGVRGW